MADITIPQLNAATSVSGTDVMVISQAGITKKVEVDKLTEKVLSSSVDILHMNPNTVQTLANIGELAFNPDTQTLEVKCSADVTLSIGQENYIRGKNAESNTILNGTVVYVSGGQGANDLIKRASNNNTTGERVIGVATQNIAANNIGFVTTNGIVNEINTSAFAEGDVLWLGVDGALTNVKPGTDVNQVCIGVVLRSHATQGSLLVSVKDDWRGQVAQLRSDLNETITTLQSRMTKPPYKKVQHILSSETASTSGTRYSYLYNVKPGYTIIAQCTIESGLILGIWDNERNALIGDGASALQAIQLNYTTDKVFATVEVEGILRVGSKKVDGSAYTTEDIENTDSNWDVNLYDDDMIPNTINLLEKQTVLDYNKPLLIPIYDWWRKTVAKGESHIGTTGTRFLDSTTRICPNSIIEIDSTVKNIHITPKSGYKHVYYLYNKDLTSSPIIDGSVWSTEEIIIEDIDTNIYGYFIYLIAYEDDSTITITDETINGVDVSFDIRENVNEAIIKNRKRFDSFEQSNSVKSTYVSALAYGKPFIIPALILPNYDTATKTLSFNSDETYKCMLFWKNTKFDIPVGTTVVDNVVTSAVQLIFNVITNEFSFVGHDIVLSENELRVAVYKRYAGFYQWDFPCSITIDGKASVADKSITTAKRTTLGEFAVVSSAGIIDFDFTTKKMKFPATGTNSNNIIWRNKFFIIPDSTEVDITITSGYFRGLVYFNTVTNQFSNRDSSTLNMVSENDILIASFWITTKSVQMNGNFSIGGVQPGAKLFKWLNSYIYIGYAYQPVVLEQGMNGNQNVYLNLPNDEATIAVRPESGFAFVKTWVELKEIFASQMTNIGGVDYITIPERCILVANTSTSTFEIIAREKLVALDHIIIAVNASGKCVAGVAVDWLQNYKTSLLTTRVANLEVGSITLPSYFADEVTDTIKKVENNTLAKSLVLSLITDSHFDGNNYFGRSATNIKEVNKIIKSDAIIHLGDMVNGNLTFEETKAILNKAYGLLRETNIPVFPVMGNHDDNSYSASLLPSNLVTKDRWFGISQRQTDMIVVRPDNKPYFYIDYPKLKVRAIVLCSSDYVLSTGGGGNAIQYGANYWGFGVDQLNWLGEIALNTENDYGVLMFSHMPTRAELNYTSADNINRGAIVEAILQAYTNKDDYTFVEGGKTFDYTSKTGIEIIGYFYGHTHGDSAKTPVGLSFPCISIANSSPSQISSQLLPVDSVAPVRVINSLTEDCWDVMTLRRDERKIYLTRFGAGDDRTIEY